MSSRPSSRKMSARLGQRDAGLNGDAIALDLEDAVHRKQRSSWVPPLAVTQRVIELPEPTGRTGVG